MYLGILAILCRVLPYLVLIKLLRKISAFSLNLVPNMELIYGIFWRDRLRRSRKDDPWFHAGAALIVLSLVLNFVCIQKSPLISEKA